MKTFFNKNKDSIIIIVSFLVGFVIFSNWDVIKDFVSQL